MVYMCQFLHSFQTPGWLEQVARGSVVFDPEGRWLVAGTGDNWEVDKTTAKMIDREEVRLFGLTQQTRSGDVLILWNGDRPSPAILVSQSRHIHISSAQVYSAQGMGFIAQYSEDIHLDRFNVILKPGSGRYVSTTGDAVHFSNCRGQIIVENGLFENMLDDGINVHGSYLRVAEKVAPDTLVLEFGHPQTFGLPFAFSGDTLRFIQPKTLEPYAIAKVTEMHSLDDKHLWIRFTEALSSSVAVKDAAENPAWQPFVIYRNNHIRHNRARGALFGSQASTVVEDIFLIICQVRRSYLTQMLPTGSRVLLLAMCWLGITDFLIQIWVLMAKARFRSSSRLKEQKADNISTPATYVSRTIRSNSSNVHSYTPLQWKA